MGGGYMRISGEYLMPHLYQWKIGINYLKFVDSMKFIHWKSQAEQSLWQNKIFMESILSLSMKAKIIENFFHIVGVHYLLWQ